jgi:predicted ATPase/class 3 adenylate cyclase
LPSGTVTFVFSDIEGSTQKWEKRRESMAAAVAEHENIVRAAIESNAGTVFKLMGDAVCAVFGRPEEAIAAALEAQRGLIALDWAEVDGLRVRMALHTGTADERDGDYYGPAVNRVARLLAIGHGGQVLVSGTSTDLLQGAMPAQSSLRDLGEHRLRDLIYPEQVYQLIAPGLPEEFPALRSLDALPNNLRRQITSFVGRDDVLADVKALVEQAQLVTLVGTGGVGKTRCAMQVAADLLDGSGDGVWFVDLAPLPAPEYVVPEIASVLGVNAQNERPLLESVLAYLKSKRTLLVIDNCEHVVREASRTIAAILQQCPQVKILATSREGLNVPGEDVYRMPSLPLPPEGAILTAAEAEAYGAVALFAERARAADKRFALSDDNATIVAEICRRLDGIALAIELAAVRVKILNVAQLSQKLDERFRLLTGGSQTLLPRQQTMRAAIDWSYELLSDDEKALFARLAVFKGGWTLEAAAAICSGDSDDEFEILERLSSLADKSLVVVEFAEGSQRYRFLESMRQYGLDRLKERGELDTIGARHAEYYGRFARQAEESMWTTSDIVWQAKVEQELDNIRTALDWSLVHKGNVALGAATVGHLWFLWMSQHPQEGRKWVQLALSLADAERYPETDVALQLAFTRFPTTDAEEKNLTDRTRRALEASRTLGNQTQLARALSYHAESLLHEGRHDEAEVLSREALAIADEIGDKARRCTVLQQLSGIERLRGNFARARELGSEALEIARARQETRSRVFALGNLAHIEADEGNLERALEISREAIAASALINDRVSDGVTKFHVADLLLQLERIEEAREFTRSSLRSLRREGMLGPLVLGIEVCGMLAGATGDARRGTFLLGFSDSASVRRSLVRDPQAQLRYDLLVGRFRDELGETEFQKLFSSGAAADEEEVIREALQV